MASSKALVGIGLLGALALVAMSSKAGASTLGGGDDCLDSDMPPDLEEQTKSLLESKNAKPADLEQAAKAMEVGGYEKAAACLRKRAKEKKIKAEVEVSEKGGMPHVIRYGDIPSLMAAYYTGDPLRFKELGPLNPQIGPLKTKDGITNYANWRPGLQILIPASWNPLDKPVPPPAQGGVKPSDSDPKGSETPNPETDPSEDEESAEAEEFFSDVFGD